MENKNEEKEFKEKKKKEKKKKKAFTLIELLAVIIILGIILVIAIPSVTKYIIDSRSKSYIMIVKEHINGATVMVNTGEYDVYNEDVTYYIPGHCIKMENNSTSSPFAEWKHRYVAFRYTGTGFEYYWESTDEAGKGIEFTKESKITVKDLKSNIEDVFPDKLIPGTGEILVLSDDCSVDSWIEHDPDPNGNNGQGQGQGQGQGSGSNTDPNGQGQGQGSDPTPDPTPDPENPNVQIDDTTWVNGPLTISISIPSGGCYDYGSNGYEMCNFGFELNNNGDREMTSWSATFNVPEDLYLASSSDYWISRYASLEISNGVLHIYSNPAGYFDIFPAPGEALVLSGAFRLVKKKTSTFSLENGDLTFTFISDDSQSGTGQGGLIGDASDMNIDLSEVNVELKRSTYWGSGGDYHAIYDVVITNISDHPINSWSFYLELPTLITTIKPWSITAQNVSGSRYLISTNNSNYLSIPANQSKTIKDAFQFDMVNINSMPIIE